jgi:nucleotide-binding universal stress UspA family protein
MSEQPSRPKIVVGIDGSDLSVEALRWAVQQARYTGAEVHAVMAWEVSTFVYLSPTRTEVDYERDAEQILDDVVAKVMGEESDVSVQQHMVRQAPGLALTHAGRDADLLVVGSHGRGELPGLHLGSVSGYCVHHAPCPVLVFRGAHTGR